MDNISLSLGQILCGPQEIVLAMRHGRSDEAEDNPFRHRQDFYRLLPSLFGREITFTQRLAIGERRFDFFVCRVHEHAGSLRRILLLDKAALKARGNTLVKPREEMLLRVAGWICARRFLTPPTSLVYVVNEFDFDGEIPRLVSCREIELTPMDDGLVEEWFSSWLTSVASSLALPDSSLPECDDDERHHVLGRNLKCFDICSARHHCPQRARQIALAQAAIVDFHLHCA